MSIPSPDELPILLVFDIDETLIQFINNNKHYNEKGELITSPYEHWKRITPEQKKNFSNLWDEDAGEYKNPLKLRDDKIYYLVI